MQSLWIWASVAAAFFQAMRYASLKALNQHLSTTVTTYVRMLFGLPWLLLYLYAVLVVTGLPLPPTNPAFFVYATIAAIGQFVCSAMLVRLFQLGNFAVGTMLAKADVILTALVGSFLFSESISLLGWVAITVTAFGVMIASAGRLPRASWEAGGGILNVILGKQVRLGIGSGFLAAISYLALREAVLVLDPAAGPFVRSAYAGAVMTGISFGLIGAYLMATEARELGRIAGHVLLCAFVGLMNAAGTIAWFTASALANAAYVAAVAQVQIVFTLVVSRYWFDERIRPLELLGIAVILAGVLMFRLV